jgi:hypothetical protein
LLHYREALTRVEALEKEEATAHPALVEWRGRIEKSTSDPAASIARSNLLGAGHEAISRLHNVRLAMSEATAELKSAFTIFAAFDDALGYLPIPEATIRTGRMRATVPKSEVTREIAEKRQRSLDPFFASA